MKILVTNCQNQSKEIKCLYLFHVCASGCGCYGSLHSGSLGAGRRWHVAGDYVQSKTGDLYLFVLYK